MYTNMVYYNCQDQARKWAIKPLVKSVVDAVPPTRSAVLKSPLPNTPYKADSMASPWLWWPKWRSMSQPDSKKATGLALFWPSMSLATCLAPYNNN